MKILNSTSKFHFFFFCRQREPQHSPTSKTNGNSMQYFHAVPSLGASKYRQAGFSFFFPHACKHLHACHSLKVMQSKGEWKAAVAVKPQAIYFTMWANKSRTDKSRELLLTSNVSSTATWANVFIKHHHTSKSTVSTEKVNSNAQATAHLRQHANKNSNPLKSQDILVNR